MIELSQIGKKYLNDCNRLVKLLCHSELIAISTRYELQEEVKNSLFPIAFPSIGLFDAKEVKVLTILEKVEFEGMTLQQLLNAFIAAEVNIDLYKPYFNNQQ